MKKILIALMFITIFLASCSKKDNKTKIEEENSESIQKTFSSDEDFKNIRSYNFVKDTIDNRIPYAQMLCINPHSFLPVSNIEPLKSKILKFQRLFKPDIITTESKDDYPTVYTTVFYQFNEKGFIEKSCCFEYSIHGGKIIPEKWYSNSYNLKEYGIETIERENGEITDKYTIGFEKEFDSLNLKVHNNLHSIIYKGMIETSGSKTTYYPDEEKYRIDYTDGTNDYTIYEDGIPIKYTENEYIYYLGQEQSFRTNRTTGEKENKPDSFEYKKLPCGLATFKTELFDKTICTYNIYYYEIMEAYDDEFILLNIYMPQEKSEE